MSLVRSFIACQLPVPVVEHLRQVQRNLRAALEGWRAGVRWTSPSSFHLTLRFLGDVEAPLVGRIGGVLRRSLESWSSTSFELGPLGCFPAQSRARVIWVGARGEVLDPLHELVEETLSGLGFEREKRPFHAHVTLGRLKTPMDLRPILERLPSLPIVEVPISEVTLFRSTLTPRGALYEALDRAPLSAPSDDPA